MSAARKRRRHLRWARYVIRLDAVTWGEYPYPYGYLRARAARRRSGWSHAYSWTPRMPGGGGMRR